MSRDRSPEQLDLPLADDGGTPAVPSPVAELEAAAVPAAEVPPAPVVVAEPNGVGASEASDTLEPGLGDETDPEGEPELERGGPVPPRTWWGRPRWQWSLGAGLFVAGLAMALGFGLRDPSPQGLAAPPPTGPVGAQARSQAQRATPEAAPPRRALPQRVPPKVKMRARLGAGRRILVALPTARGRFAIVLAFAPKERRFRLYPFERGESISVDTAGWLPGSVELGGVQGQVRLLVLISARPLSVSDVESTLPASWDGNPGILRRIAGLEAWSTTVVR